MITMITSLSIQLLAILLILCNGQSCTERFMELSLLKYRAGQISSGVSSSIGVLDPQVRLLTDIEFTCPTVITNVLLGINVLTVTDTRNTYPSILLVRRLGTHYTVLAEQTIYYTTENVSTNGVYNYSLNHTISVNAGDILGIRVNSHSEAVTIHYEKGVTYHSQRILNLGNANIISSISDELVLVYPIADTSTCLTSSTSAEKVLERSLNINGILWREHQYIYPELRFSCTGNIMKWIFGATEWISQHMHPELQIWRQTGPDTYTKIGFSSVTANATASPNVYEYYPETTLQFQQGDVLGVYYPNINITNPLLYMQNGNGPLNLIKNHINSPSFILNISQLNIGINHFPLVSLVVVAGTPTETMPSIQSTITGLPSVSIAPSPINTTNRPNAPVTTAISIVVGIIALTVIAINMSAIAINFKRRLAKVGTSNNNEVIADQFTTTYHLVREQHSPPITDQDIAGCHSYVDMSVGKQFDVSTNVAYNAYTEESAESNQVEYEYVRSPVSPRQIDISVHTEDETSINYHYYI